MENLLSMKRICLSPCLLIACSAHAFAQGQKVTVNLTNASLTELFATIEKQTSYRFSYREVFIDNQQDISIHVAGAKVSSVLDQAFAGRNLEYNSVSPKSIVISDKEAKPAKGTRPSKKIPGKVNDSSAQPLMGVRVFAKDSKKGSVTDIDGEYQIVANEGETLLSPYVGYLNKEQRVGASSTINIQLEENSKALTEVVAVGYGAQSRAKGRGAVSEITPRIWKGGR